MVHTHRRLPDFSAYDPTGIADALHAVLDTAQTSIDALCAVADPTWQNFVEPLTDSCDAIDRYWSPVSHLNAVMSTDALRDAYNAGLQTLQAFYTDLGQNRALYDQYAAIAAGPEYERFDTTQRVVVDKALRDFRLSGVDLEGEARERYREISLRLSELGSRYQDQLLDATNAWSITLDDDTRLAGLPEHSKQLLAQMAEQAGAGAYVVNLQMPSYVAVMTYAEDRSLREAVYSAYNTRASDRGPHAGQWDNRPVIDELLALRQEKAGLLGFESYAALSLATKMAGSATEVTDFLRDLAGRSRAVAEDELLALRDFAAEHGLDGELQPWDTGYYAEKLRLKRHAISSEELKPYFPADRAISGLFAVANRLFGVSIEPVAGADSYHDDVQLYRISRNGEEIGNFYFDLYSRPSKRGGAWMAGCVDRNRVRDDVQLPATFMVCNLTPPLGDAPALFDHQEVTTLFHEFGHGLHHMLTRIDNAAIAGINGVEWDAVELPSQFLENWCWQRESLDVIAAHHETGDAIPEDLLSRAQAAKNFGAGMQMLRQVEFGLFDMLIHSHEGEAAVDVQGTLDAVRTEVSLLQPPAENRFQCGFSHLFAGGYAAGYFSYKWAEVLSADAFSRFEEEGVFSDVAGTAFREEVLERGGSRPAMESFVAFRGREPTVDALLRHNGLAA
ncbi:MAG: M3 family metallopeptidase [Pseudomonadota bacterium]